ncbi:unnamed protein product [Paramecium sonneborni]|uniref:Protein kinase domain-containing protein n=1 Tax=Paramecium sonneborni TaxID=65129 RepID=A0A8S1PVY5_9CILI|nr:unnamed protein product [Paramecium sonneborni]
MATKYQQILEGKYGILKVIGKGEFGEVYLAENIQTKQQVAIKQAIKLELEKVKKRQELFQTEKRIMQMIVNENVISLIDHIETKDKHYLVMEYCNGGDLDSYIKLLREKNKQPLSERQAKEFLKQLLNGFKGLQDMFVIHRDLKLKNILVHDGIIKIADFGLSKVGEVGVTQVGTPYTKAPEVFKGRGRIRYDNKADIWSLGVIFYQMLFDLQYPFVGQNEKDLFDNIEKAKDLNFTPAKTNVRISDDAKRLLRRMLTKDPNQRITWDQLYQDPYLEFGQQKDLGTFDQFYQNIMNKFSMIRQLQFKIQETLGNSESLRKDYKVIKNLNQYYVQYMLAKRIIILSRKLDSLISQLKNQQKYQSKSLNEIAKETEENCYVYQLYYENAKFNLESFINRRKNQYKDFDEYVLNELQNSKQMDWQYYTSIVLNYFYCLSNQAEIMEGQNETKALQFYDHMIDILKCLESDSAFEGEKLKFKSQSNDDLEQKQNNGPMMGEFTKEQYIQIQKMNVKELFEIMLSDI